MLGFDANSRGNCRHDSCTRSRGLALGDITSIGKNQSCENVPRDIQIRQVCQCEVRITLCRYHRRSWYPTQPLEPQPFKGDLRKLINYPRQKPQVLVFSVTSNQWPVHKWRHLFTFGLFVALWLHHHNIDAFSMYVHTSRSPIAMIMTKLMFDARCFDVILKHGRFVENI